MLVAFALWLLAAISEFLLYRAGPDGVHIRRWWAGLTIGLLLVSGTWLAWYDPGVWAAVWLIGWYRVICLARMAYGRLQHNELQRVSLRAYGWLLVLQVAAYGVGWLVTRHHIATAYAFCGFLALQLAMAMVMLRVSINTWRHTRPGLMATSLTDAELPTVSVLVPARNETDDLEACLRKLVASDYPKLEIVVLDDCSVTRATPDIIRSFAHDGVRFIEGAVPDEVNWLAKNQAYARLAEQASGDVLLFCGVDVQFEPKSIRLLIERLERKQKDMISVLPLRVPGSEAWASLLQPMRYFWELCLPRRIFKRPPVLSTCWLIRAAVLKRDGGFAAVSRSVVPEAHFARRAVIGDRYSFIRATAELGIASNKPASEQYATSVRVRYPQLHRRLELVVILALMELFFWLGPLIGLAVAALLPHSLLLSGLWLAEWLMFEVMYYLVAVRTRLNSPWLAWLLFPAAVGVDIVLLHISLLRYEFSDVDWKGRNICIPVMRVEPRLPKLS
jgi:glycosyltransferase involved in cell wall biosynthesis